MIDENAKLIIPALKCWRADKWIGDEGVDPQCDCNPCRADRIMRRQIEQDRATISRIVAGEGKPNRYGSVPEMCGGLLRDERDELLAAIVEHHAQKADDRCIEDDDKLYAAAGLPPCDRKVGDKAAMLKNCERFIDKRCEGGKWPTYVELEAENERLQLALDAALTDAQIVRYREARSDAEVARLTAALHANRCHPSFLYTVAPPDNPIDLSEAGYEPNPEAVVAPGDVCWRRRKESC